MVVVKDWWFFVRVALEYDLGLARSYMAGEFEVRRRRHMRHEVTWGGKAGRFLYGRGVRGTQTHGVCV